MSRRRGKHSPSRRSARGGRTRNWGKGTLLSPRQRIVLLALHRNEIPDIPEPTWDALVRKGYIDAARLEELGRRMKKNGYGEYLLRLAAETRDAGEARR